MPKVTAGGIQIHYEVQGTGEPVMLLVGLPGVGRGWGPQIELFARNYLTIVPDQRGGGQSSWPNNGYTIEQHAADMAEVIHHLGCGPAHLIGSSTGGAIAQVMALDHPDTVRSATIMGSWAAPDDFFRHEFETRKRILQEAGMPAYIDASVLFLFSPAYFRDHYDEVTDYCLQGASAASDPDIMVRRIDMILSFNQKHRLGQIRHPVLVLVGDQDTCTPPYFSEELTRLIPGAEMDTLEGGHLVYWERPEEFYARVVRFLAEH